MRRDEGTEDKNFRISVRRQNKKRNVEREKVRINLKINQKRGNNRKQMWFILRLVFLRIFVLTSACKSGIILIEKIEWPGARKIEKPGRCARMCQSGALID